MRRVQLAIPTLTTERLSLRPFREGDAADLFELSQDPDVVRYVGDRRFDEMISLIDPANAASIGVATRLGETLRDEIKLWGHRVRRYAITRQTWQTRVPE